MLFTQNIFPRPRFGQFIINIMSTSFSHDPFYLEEDEMLKEIKKMFTG